MVREMSPDTEAYVLYKDIRSPGQYEAFYQKAQEDTGIFFTKAEVTGVRNGGGTPHGGGRRHPSGWKHPARGRPGGPGHRNGPPLGRRRADPKVRRRQEPW